MWAASLAGSENMLPFPKATAEKGGDLGFQGWRRDMPTGPAKMFPIYNSFIF
jgi:hypothetical protein